MKMLSEPPKKIHCPECGSEIALDVIQKILWD